MRRASPRFKQRDQDVELRWPPLHAVLTEVARVGRNKEQYGALRGKNQQYFSSTVFEVLPDGILRRHKGLHQGKASAVNSCLPWPLAAPASRSPHACGELAPPARPHRTPTSWRRATPGQTARRAQATGSAARWPSRSFGRSRW